MEWIKMPRPLRVPNDEERAALDIIKDINETIQRNIERNKNLAADRRKRVIDLMMDGWSMYGIGKETGITPNTVKRILESRHAG
jgi:DNA-binding NarL/FixJ family response regulator